MAAKVKKVVTLANATFDELCELPRDNFNDGDFSIMTDSKVVWLSEQHRGESNKQHIEIPRAVFNRLIRKYSSEQKPTRAKE